MKAKVTTGAGLRGLVRYQTGKQGSSFVCGSQAQPSDFLREVAALRALRPDCSKPALHFSLSLPGGETLDNADWARVCEAFIAKMNLADHAFFAVRHTDAGHDHIHIAACMISPSGQRWDSNKSALRAQEACAQLEREFGLTQTRTLDDFRLEEGSRRRVVRDGATNEFRRTGRVKSSVQRAIQARYSRKKKEQSHEPNREAHQSADLRDVGLADRQPANPGSNHGERETSSHAGSRAQQGFQPDRQFIEANRIPGTAPDRIGQSLQITAAARIAAPKKENDMIKFIPLPPDSAGALEAAPILKSMLPQPSDPSAPPLLGGRLTAVKLSTAAPAHDLYWADRADGKPTFRWQADSQRLLILAQPNEKNVCALFDAAQEKGIGLPQVQISGTPEFQRLAAVEAAKRGLPVDTSKLDESARELYRQTFSREHGEAANSVCASAYESQAADEQRRAAEAEAARAVKDKDGERSSSAERMRG